MIKVGDIVKLLNPKNQREVRRRWRIKHLTETIARGRRLDTATRRLEYWEISILTPISPWERITRRY